MTQGLSQHDEALSAMRSALAAQVPLLSYWMSRSGEIWKVIEKREDGTCLLKRSGQQRYKAGPLRSLVLGYQKI